MTNNQPTVGEVLCEMCFTNTVTGDTPKDCYMHKKGITKDCDKLQQALTKLTEIIESCFPEDRPLQLEGTPLKSYVSEQVFRNKLIDKGFPLNKGGENGK